MTSTIREILVEAQQRFGPEVAVRYKVGKNQIEDKTYDQLRQDSAGNRKALILPDGKRTSPFLQGAVNALRQCFYKAVCAGNLQRRIDLFIGCAWPNKAERVRNRAGENHIVLRDIGEQGACSRRERNAQFTAN